MKASWEIVIKMLTFPISVVMLLLIVVIYLGGTFLTLAIWCLHRFKDILVQRRDRGPRQ